MCLLTIDAKIRLKNPDAPRKAYKWLKTKERYSDDDVLKFPHSHNIKGNLVIGKEYKAKRAYLYAPCGGSYYAGFHCFLSKAEARLYKRKTWITGKSALFQVEISGISTTGKQNDARVVVSKTMKIIKKVEQT